MTLTDCLRTAANTFVNVLELRKEQIKGMDRYTDFTASLAAQTSSYLIKIVAHSDMEAPTNTETQ